MATKKPTLNVLQGGAAMGMGIADYVWLNPDGELIFKKKVILIGRNESGDPIPLLDRWTYVHRTCDCEDSCPGQNMVLSPCFYLPDPTRPQPHYIVLCEVRDGDDHPVAWNHRASLRKALDARGKQSNLVWFGFEQSYKIVEVYDVQDPARAEREFLTTERHFGACFDAGLLIHSCWNPAWGQTLDFKVGVRRFPQDLDPDPPNALVVADHLIIARYLLEKVAAEKSLQPHWEDLCAFVSTATLREPGGDTDIEATLISSAVQELGTPRSVPGPRGGTECVEVGRKEPADPYKLALDVLTAVWPLEPPQEQP